MHLPQGCKPVHSQAAADGFRISASRGTTPERGSCCDRCEAYIGSISQEDEQTYEMSQRQCAHGPLKGAANGHKGQHVEGHMQQAAMDEWRC